MTISKSIVLHTYQSSWQLHFKGVLTHLELLMFPTTVALWNGRHYEMIAPVLAPVLAPNEGMRDDYLTEHIHIEDVNTAK